jgi:nucleotide sugar dehydrogenase
VKITVVGLGKIGLPLAVQFAKKGHLVFGGDISESIVSKVTLGIAPFPGEQGLSTRLSEVINSSTLTATLKIGEAVEASDVVVVTVPLVVDKKNEPDFRALDSATREIGKSLTVGILISFETTLPVGTTRNRLCKILEQESGLVAGEDFYVVFSPERVSSGRIFSDLRKYPKLVGGITPMSEGKGVEFYESVLDFDERQDLPRANGVWPLGSSEAAELAKLAETTYRDVNIALANQFAMHAASLGVDIYPVIDACNSQPYSHIHQPGIAVGGHCIPVYPHLYLHGDPQATVVEAAREANKRMPEEVIRQIELELGTLENLKVLVLGLSYRGGVKEHAFSGAWDLVKIILAKKGKPLVHDPLYSADEIAQLGLSPQELGEECDVAILHTNHEEYKNLKPDDLPGVKLVFDGRNFLSEEIRSSLNVLVLGKGRSQEE